MRQPKHKTLQNLIQYSISKYYVERERDPTLKTNLEAHIRIANRIENFYQKELETKYESWNTEEARGAVRKCIDFLTKIYTKKEEEERRKKELQEMKSKIKPLKYGQ